MKIVQKYILISLVAFTALSVSGNATAAEPAPARSSEAYLIGPGDILDISVWKNPDLTKTVTVLPDGKIAFPLVGELHAANNTRKQLSNELRSRLKRFVPEANLSVVVVQVNSMLVYVIGRVNNPGHLVLNTKINVMQALAMAGGLNPFAKRDSIKIVRNSESAIKYFDFDYDSVFKGSKPAQNILLKRGDVIMVP